MKIPLFYRYFSIAFSMLIVTFKPLCGWMGPSVTRFSANPRFALEGRKYAMCTLAEGPLRVFWSKAPELLRAKRALGV